MGNSVERSLYYYDAILKEFDDQKKKLISVENAQDVMFHFFEQINELNILDRSIRTDTNNKLYIIIDDINPENRLIKYRIVLVKVDALPLVEKDGDLESLEEYLEANQNIAEITHSVFFADYGVIGSEFNFAGARPKAIANYINFFSHEWGHTVVCDCTPKLNRDAYEKIIEGKDFSLVDIAVKCDSEAYKKLRGNKSTFKSIFEGMPDDVDIVEVKLKKRKTKQNDYKGFMVSELKKELMEIVPAHREDFSRFVICQDSITRDSIDLLSDKMVTRREFVKTKKRQIDSDEMYTAIIKFFNSDVKKQCSK